MEPYNSHYSHQPTNRNINSKNQRILEMYAMLSSNDDDADLVLSSVSTATTMVNTTSTIPKQSSILDQYQYPRMNDHNDFNQLNRSYPDLHWNYIDHTKAQDESNELLNASNDPILAHKMSQLSTTAKFKKNILLNTMKDEIEKIPNYLTKQHQSFQQMVHQVQSKITTMTTDDIEELKELATLIYKIMIIQTYHVQWTAYLKSGLGQLIIPDNQKPLSLSTVPIWPEVIKRMVQLKNKDNRSNENELYLNFVNHQLSGLGQQLQQYQIELNIKSNNFQGYTLSIQNLIEKYIEQNLQSFRMQIEHEIELLHYDYFIQGLKLEYLKQHPNKYQIKLMKQMCESKYEQEATEQEYQLLNQQITFNNLPSQSFENSSAAQSLPLNSIEDVNRRLQVLNQYKEIAEQARAKIFRLYMTSAEGQREEYKKKYNDLTQKMWSDYQLSNENQKPSSLMIQLINQLCDQIGERTKCIYKFKAQLI